MEEEKLREIAVPAESPFLSRRDFQSSQSFLSLTDLKSPPTPDIPLKSFLKMGRMPSAGFSLFSMFW